MKNSLKIGLCFGLTSGIITTLGLIVGLHSGTHSILAIIGGVITIAVADSFSDALGMHVSQESENHKAKEIWESTMATFLVKFFLPLTFLVPILFLELGTAILVSVAWGLLLLGVLSFMVARERKERPFNVIAEHVTITIIVVIITHYVGDLISILFG